ncbi:MAG: PAS domain-containing protein, partial [Candidatus Dadabacteria bacterium]|nr:PAS domain-containing protein [Candidatus Dadabacteria bacterium]
MRIQNESLSETRQYLHRYKDIITGTTDMVAFLDKNFRYVIANQAYLDGISKNIDEVIGHTPAEFFGNEFFENNIKPHAEKCL